jgi:hypothetical protein
VEKFGNSSIDCGVRLMNILTTSQLVATIQSSLKPSTQWFDSHKHKIPTSTYLFSSVRFVVPKFYGECFLESASSRDSCVLSVNPIYIHRPTFDRVSRWFSNFTREPTMQINCNFKQLCYLSKQNQSPIKQKTND